MRYVVIILFVILFGSTLKAQPIPYLAKKVTPIEKGKETLLLPEASDNALVIFFLSPECPLCQSYSLTIQNLFKSYAAKGVRFAAVIPGTEDSKESIIEYRNKYGLKAIPFYRDSTMALTHSLKASITPEVFVINSAKQVVYSGRIDNWAYELGKKRTVITKHDLQEVLTKIVNKQALKPYKTKAVGCFIE